MNRFGKLFTSGTVRLAARQCRRGYLRPEVHMTGWLGLVIMVIFGVGFAGLMIGLSVLLGPKNPTPEKLAPYECGMPAVGDARERHSVKFYLVAMIFLLFDIEVAFLYPWAVALRSLGWFGFFQILTFFLILLVGYVYVWRKGVLDWGPALRRPRSQSTQQKAA